MPDLPPKVKKQRITDLRREIARLTTSRNYYWQQFEYWHDMCAALAEIAKRFSPDAAAVRSYYELVEKDRQDREQNRLRIYGNGSRKPRGDDV